MYAGLALLAVCGWALTSAGAAIVNGHPSYWVLYTVAMALGILAMVLSAVWRSNRTRVWPAVLGTAGLLAFAGVAWWLAPFEATESALQALESDDEVVVASSASAITMTPVAGHTGVGVIFQPGARIDSRAYARILRPIAEAGHHVVIVKQPLGIAILASGFAPAWAADHLELDTWVAAGHSLGGVVAADNAAALNAVDDLILWASFPASDLSSGEFGAVSVFGTADGLTTIDSIERSVDYRYPNIWKGQALCPSTVPSTLTLVIMVSSPATASPRCPVTSHKIGSSKRLLTFSRVELGGADWPGA